jgi:hypothetical protein
MLPSTLGARLNGTAGAFYAARVPRIPDDDGFAWSGPAVDQARRPDMPQAARPRPISGLATGVTLTLVAAIGLEITLAATAPPTKAAPQPSQVLAETLVAAGTRADFHYRAQWETGGLAQTIVGDARLSSGAQSVSVGGARFSAELVDQVVYFRGDAAALRDQLGLPTVTALSDSGKWISLQQSDGPYQSIEQGMTTETALSQVLIVPSAVSSSHPTRGARSVRITGQIPPGSRNQVVTGTARLNVSARTKLPSSYLARGSNGGQPWSASITYTRWGEDVPVTAPPVAISFGSLQGAATPGP